MISPILLQAGGAIAFLVGILSLAVHMAIIYRLNRASASGLDPEGEARRMSYQTT